MPVERSWKLNIKYCSRFSQSVLNDMVAGKTVVNADVRKLRAGRKTAVVSLAPKNLPDVCLREFSVSPLNLFRSFFFPYGKKEWQTARCLRDRDVPAVYPIAFGVEKNMGFIRKTYLVSEKITRAVTVKAFIETNPDADLSQRKRFIRAFSEFILQIHMAGVLHTDLNWENIFVSAGPGGEYRFFLSDLHRVRLKHSIPLNLRLSNLALLNTSFYQKTSVRGRTAFLNHYLKSFIKTGDMMPRIREIINSETKLILLKKWKKQVKRCLQENRDFTQIAFENLKGWVCRPLADGGVAQMKNPEMLFQDSRARILKRSARSASLLFPDVAGAPGFYLKRYRVKGLWNVLKDGVRPSRAKKSWVASNVLMARNIPTPRPILFLEKKHFLFTPESYFMTEALPKALTLASYMDQVFQSLPVTAKRRVLRDTALQVRKLHDNGIRHRDLKATNILISRNVPLKLWFADLDAIAVSDALSLSECSKDLARLNCSFLDRSVLSASERLYFLKTYLGREKREELKKRWHSVVFFTRLKLKKSNRAFC